MYSFVRQVASCLQMDSLSDLSTASEGLLFAFELESPASGGCFDWGYYRKLFAVFDRNM